jgi:nucleoside-diphosphate-sugar epimerase
VRVFIVGPTGVLGRALIPLLVAAGAEVRASVRSMERATRIEMPGVEFAFGDLLTIEPAVLATQVEGCDAVLHLATAIGPAPGKGDMAATAALRTDGTRKLLTAALAAGAKRYVQQSIVMAYVDGGDRWLDESTAFDRSPRFRGGFEPVARMEAIVRQVDGPGLHWTILRGGAFVGPDTFQDDAIARLTDGTMRVPGDGTNFISPVHVEDVATAVVAALERAPAGSTFNIVDEPLRNGEYLDRLAAAVGAPAPPRDAGLRQPLSHRCTNRAAREQLSWEPRHSLFPSA